RLRPGDHRPHLREPAADRRVRRRGPRARRRPAPGGIRRCAGGGPVNPPVIVDMARTPFGKRNGWVSTLHAAELMGVAQRGVLERTGVDPRQVDEVVGGCVTPLGEQYGHITRTAWLHAGLLPHTGATTIDAQCSTAQRAVQLIAGQIALGATDVGLACGVELMTRAPLTAKARSEE